jgi:hypothetical protein
MTLELPKPSLEMAARVDFIVWERSMHCENKEWMSRRAEGAEALHR